MDSRREGRRLAFNRHDLVESHCWLTMHGMLVLGGEHVSRATKTTS